MQQSRAGRPAGGVDAEFSIYVGNLDPDTSLSDVEELIYELFLQVSSRQCCGSDI